MNSTKKKSSRKSEENSSKSNEEERNNLLYLQSEYAQFPSTFSKCNIGEIISQPKGVQFNEWIATNFIHFYDHINLFYEVLSDLCTNLTCPTMNGAQNSIYSLDEKNKKVKCSAPEYVGNAMIFIRKTITNEEIFPTRLDKDFVSTFDVLIRRMFRLLYHCLSHLYANHYSQLIQLEFHFHLNSLFLHLISFLIKSDLIQNENASINVIHYLSLSISAQSETRELRSELQSLALLYQLLAKRWQHVYAQQTANKKT